MDLAKVDDVKEESFNKPDALAKRMESEGQAAIKYELMALVHMALENPRDEGESLRRMLVAAKRIEFAEDAEYHFPRGGKEVRGPSVKLARPIATYWGHIRFGTRILSETEETRHIGGYAHDLQTGAYTTAEDSFKKLQQRKVRQPDGSFKTEWVKPDERDLRELTNRRSAILVRNCILAIVPGDIVDRVVDECHRTMVAKEEGNLKVNREDVIRNTVIAWGDIGVTREMLETYLAHPVELVTPDELVKLRGVWKSIQDGNSKPTDHFDLPPRGPAPTESAKVDLSNVKAGVAVDPPGGAPFTEEGKAKRAEAEHKPVGKKDGGGPRQ